jgi:hypothetical protein
LSLRVAVVVVVGVAQVLVQAVCVQLLLQQEAVVL